MAQPTSAPISAPPTTSSRSESSSSSSSSSPPPPPSSWARPLKQFSLFALGASFTAASVFVARRSVLRRQAASIPRFYAPNPPPTPVLDRLQHLQQHSGPHSGEGALLGVHALGLATLNVCSFGVLLTGGLAWGFDLSSVGELRERTQRALRGGGYAVSEEDEEEFERMVNDVLARLGMEKMIAAGESTRMAGGDAATGSTTTTKKD